MDDKEIELKAAHIVYQDLVRHITDMHIEAFGSDWIVYTTSPKIAVTVLVREIHALRKERDERQRA